MRISYDPAKRALTLARRELDFDNAVEVFAGSTIDVLDDRRDYGEVRWVTYGLLNARMVAVVWTQRDIVRHVISMRKANDRERTIYAGALDRSG